MAARDKTSYALRCPKCSTVGKVYCSEEDHKYIKDLGHQIDRIEGLFEIRKEEAGGDSKQKIICSKCRVLVTF